MSLFSSIGKVLKGAVKAVAPLASMVPGPIGIAGRVITAGTMIGSAAGVAAAAGRALPNLPAVIPGAGRIVSTVGRVGGVGAVVGAARGAAARYPGVVKWTKRAAEAAGYYVIGRQILDSSGMLVGQTAVRRINPLNHRALSRACRRIKSAKKILKKVERITGGSARRTSCAPKRARKC
jgi:hypothetical protein